MVVACLFGIEGVWIFVYNETDKLGWKWRQKMKIGKIIRGMISILTIGSILTVFSVTDVYAGVYKAQKTSVKKEIYAKGEYSNWEGVSNVSQFADADGNFCFAYDSGKYVKVVKTKGGVPLKKTVKLKKVTSTFGAATCDSDGYYYVVTGKKNKTGNTDVNTIFITKYDPEGKLVQSIGDNGSSSLAYYYDNSFYTKTPFDAGTCDVAINGEYLAVNYAREMYSGHQSNSLFLVNKNTMTKVQVCEYYNSHSFAQRVIPYMDRFLLASEGDCYDRAFTISLADVMGTCESQNIFDFWVKKGTLDAYDMYVLNNNFAHMGGIATAADYNAAFVATSAKSLSSAAKKEKEQLFIQIFDPQKNLSMADSYLTTGIRSGVAGPNGNENVTNYGVRWLTDYSSKYRIENPQIVAGEDGTYIVLFERYKSGKPQGVFYTTLDSFGNTVTKIKKISSKASLNPYEMPVYIDGTVYWAGNCTTGKARNIYIHSLHLK